MTTYPNDEALDRRQPILSDEWSSEDIAASQLSCEGYICMQKWTNKIDRDILFSVEILWFGSRTGETFDTEEDARKTYNFALKVWQFAGRGIIG